MTKLSITCGSHAGELHVRLSAEDEGPKNPYVLDGAGNRYTPAIFEIYAGYRSKKWKWSFFVHEDGEVPKRFCEWIKEKEKQQLEVDANTNKDEEDFGMRFLVACPKCEGESAALASADWFFTCPIAECGHVFQRKML